LRTASDLSARDFAEQLVDALSVQGVEIPNAGDMGTKLRLESAAEVLLSWVEDQLPLACEVCEGSAPETQATDSGG